MWGFACQSKELGPFPGGTGEPGRALRQEESMVGPEIHLSGSPGRVSQRVRMKAGRPVWRVVLLIWLYF